MSGPPTGRDCSRSSPGPAVTCTRAASPDTPAWTWSDDQTVGFIRRRQAHEALIHRVDAELTMGDRTSMDPDLSADGVDEALRFMLPGQTPGSRFTPDPAQTARIKATDTNSSWLATLGRVTFTEDEGTAHHEPGVTVAATDSAEPAAAAVLGAAADLDCWLWHRPTRAQLSRSGDPTVLQRLDQALEPGID